MADDLRADILRSYGVDRVSTERALDGMQDRALAQGIAAGAVGGVGGMVLLRKLLKHTNDKKIAKEPLMKRLIAAKHLIFRKAEDDSMNDLLDKLASAGSYCEAMEYFEQLAEELTPEELEVVANTVLGSMEKTAGDVNEEYTTASCCELLEEFERLADELSSDEMNKIAEEFLEKEALSLGGMKAVTKNIGARVAKPFMDTGAKAVNKVRAVRMKSLDTKATRIVDNAMLHGATLTDERALNNLKGAYGNLQSKVNTTQAGIANRAKAPETLRGSYSRGRAEATSGAWANKNVNPGGSSVLAASGTTVPASGVNPQSGAPVSSEVKPQSGAPVSSEVKPQSGAPEIKSGVNTKFETEYATWKKDGTRMSPESWKEFVGKHKAAGTNYMDELNALKPTWKTPGQAPQGTGAATHGTDGKKKYTMSKEKLNQKRSKKEPGPEASKPGGWAQDFDKIYGQGKDLIQKHPYMAGAAALGAGMMMSNNNNRRY